MTGALLRGPALLWADYRALCARKRPGAAESRAKAAALALPRIAADANLHANVLVRAVTSAPPPLRGLAQRTLLWSHGMLVDPGARIGGGLFLPHPLGIVIGPGVELGEGVSLFHSTTLWAARVGDRARIFTGAAVLGPCVVGAEAVVGAGAVVVADVPAGGRALAERGVAADGSAAREDAAGLEPRAGALWDGRRVGLLLAADHRARFGGAARVPGRALVAAAMRDRGFRVVALARLQQAGPPPLWRLWRRLLLLHGCDVGRDARLGPGLAIPRPVGVVVGRRSRLGAGVTLHEHVTVTPTRMAWREAPVGPGLALGDGVCVQAGAGVFGDVALAPGTLVAPRAVLGRTGAAGPPPAAAACAARRAVQPGPAPPTLAALVRADLDRLAPTGAMARLRAAAGLPLQGAVLLRLATGRRPRLRALGRALLASVHHSYVAHDVQVGAGILLPAPTGICLAAGTRIGSGVTLQDRVSLAAGAGGGAPVLADGAQIGSGAVLAGPCRVEGHVAAGALVVAEPPERTFTEPPPRGHAVATA